MPQEALIEQGRELAFVEDSQVAASRFPPTII
jgi:hypothetical protein